MLQLQNFIIWLFFNSDLTISKMADVCAPL